MSIYLRIRNCYLFVFFLCLRISDSKFLAVFFPPSPLFCPQGIRARILETLVMLILLALLILGIVWVASALIDNDAASMESLYGMEFKKTPHYFNFNYGNGCFQLNVFLVNAT